MTKIDRGRVLHLYTNIVQTQEFSLFLELVSWFSLDLVKKTTGIKDTANKNQQFPIQYGEKSNIDIN